MKLSDAMILGSTTCEMKAGDWNTCALGAAGNAIGIAQGHDTAAMLNRITAIKKAWPWIDNKAITVGSRWGDRIYNAFDYSVCKGIMTYDKLVEFVRSVEPECGECNMFECVCKKAEVKEEQCQESLV